MLPNHRFDCGPASIAISWDDDGHFVVRLRLEVRDAREEDVEELAASLDHVSSAATVALSILRSQLSAVQSSS